MVNSLHESIPVDIKPELTMPDAEPSAVVGQPYGTFGHRLDEQKLTAYVTGWRNQLRTARIDKQNIWTECWQMYRGMEDFSDKEEWQSKIVLPKAWSSVKQATSMIKRLLSAAKEPWNVESENPEDLVMAIRGSQMTDLTKMFLDNAHYLEAFAEGLECSFITGIGLWKVWWGLKPRTRVRIVNTPPQQLPNGQIQPSQKQGIKEEIMEGQLFVRAVDPYNFYWLPGSKPNQWVGTIEEIETPRWDLLRMVKDGIIDKKDYDRIVPKQIPERDKYSFLRFSERPTPINGPNADTGVVQLTEYFGPIVCDGEIVEEHGHLIVANDTVLLNPTNIRNQMWQKRPPYIGCSPLAVPFRTDGVGLVEMVRQIDKALNKIANLSVDTLLFRLMPMFEVNLEAYENPQDFETGITPGKILRRNATFQGQNGIVPVQFEDISGGALQVSATLDRSHQEGSMVSEIQSAIPRYRGLQSATEIETKNENQNSFFGAMAADIELQAITPLVEMACDLIFQFIDTANDPRIASVLGVSGQALQGMTRPEIMEMIQGDYKVKVTGITGQLQKAEMLQNLTQLMNIIGQNPQAWMPYLNQDELLRRVLEAFRPALHDIEKIIADPETQQAAKAAAGGEAQTLQLMQMMPELVRMASEVKQQQAQIQQEQQKLQMQAQQQHVAMLQAATDNEVRKKELELEERKIAKEAVAKE